MNRFRGRRMLLGSILVLLAVLVSNVRPTQAILWQLTDTFDSSPASRWSFEGTISPTWNRISGGGTDPTLVHTAPGFAAIGTYYFLPYTTSDWISVRRTVSITPFLAGRKLSCVAGVWVRLPDAAKINFEVIDPATWNYVALNSAYHNSTGSGWIQITTNTWNPPAKNVVIRITRMYGDSYSNSPQVFVDDLAVQCQYY